MILYGRENSYDIFERGDRLSEFFDAAQKYGFSGNLKKDYIALLLMHDENAFSLSCERRGNSGGSLEDFARLDIAEIYSIFNSPCDGRIENYSPMLPIAAGENIRIGKCCMDFAEKLSAAKSSEEFFDTVVNFYREYGVGELGMNKAFIIDESGSLSAVTHMSDVTLDDLWGYETQKEQLCRNTEAFLENDVANNVLLYGEAGTGKSTSMKAVLNRYFPNGLRMIGAQKSQFASLPALLDKIKERNYRFVIYMDDLSFDDYENEYKYLKAIIEGGLEEKPSNVLIYATSNRRHLVKEKWSDRDGDDIHRNETIQERISLSDRFGLSILFLKPVQADFFEMVKYLAEKNGIDIPEDELIDRARKWSVSHSSATSGRTAAQFILSLRGRK